MYVGRKNRARKNSAFTLIEVLVTAVIVAVAMVGVYGGIGVLSKVDSQAHTADLLQRLATEKIQDVELLATPSANGSTGDFTDRGYPDITWSLDDQPSGVTNVDQITMTVTRGSDSQAVTTLVYLSQQATTSTTTSTSTSTGTATP